jgi:hypothetical protein
LSTTALDVKRNILLPFGKIVKQHLDKMALPAQKGESCKKRPAGV